MTSLTRIEIRGRGELPLVLVAVTVRTFLKFDLEQGVFAPGSVTLVAFQVSVLTLKRISRSGMFLEAKQGWAKALYGVARGALDTAGPLGKLSVVRIRLVAIHAFLEGNRLLEIAVLMALRALDGLVLSQ
jgi:hypothetical protein